MALHAEQPTKHWTSRSYRTSAFESSVFKLSLSFPLGAFLSCCGVRLSVCLQPSSFLLVCFNRGPSRLVCLALSWIGSVCFELSRFVSSLFSLPRSVSVCLGLSRYGSVCLSMSPTVSICFRLSQFAASESVRYDLFWLSRPVFSLVHSVSEFLGLSLFALVSLTHNRFVLVQIMR